MTIADVMLHVNETLDMQYRARLADDLRLCEGVVGVSFSPKASHLMTVLYDCDRLQGLDLLQQVRGQGLHGQVVGML
jgi:hypothetical protein